jgi:hypothetical protein
MSNVKGLGWTPGYTLGRLGIGIDTRLEDRIDTRLGDGIDTRICSGIDTKHGVGLTLSMGWD